jgi:PTS system N-acetylglucosamine-specific IIC component
VGLVYGAIYYGVFRFAIVRFDLKTPGREDEPAPAIEAVTTGGGRGSDFLVALGGAANLVSVDACTTRLRLIVNDQGQVNASALKALGARGVVKPSDKALQVVLGPIADAVAGEIRAAIAVGGTNPTLSAATKAASTPRLAASPSPSEADRRKAEHLVQALGGRANLRDIAAVSSRLRIVLIDPAHIDPAAVQAAGGRGVVRPGEGVIHIVLGAEAEGVADAMRDLA